MNPARHIAVPKRLARIAALLNHPPDAFLMCQVTHMALASETGDQLLGTRLVALYPCEHRLKKKSLQAAAG
jgi:hypothetical protein